MQTIKQTLDGMPANKKDAAYAIIGAVAEGETLPEEITALYLSMTKEQQAAIDFIAGGVDTVEHAEEDGPLTLIHFGIKGMRWGVRNAPGTGGRKPGLSNSTSNTAENRAVARAKVKIGGGTLKDAHLASLKSTGHRIANGVLGDKKFWKKTGIIAGVAALGLGAAAAAPAVIPTATLVNLGIGTGAMVGGGSTAVGGVAATLSPAFAADMAIIGTSIVQAAGFTAVGVGTAGATAANYAGNVKRAITGNRTVNRSAEAVGRALHKHQSEGSKKVRKTLMKAGGVDIRQSALDTDEFLAHFGIRGMRWGVRRENPSGSPAVVKRAVPGKKIKTAGGKGHAPTDDALKAALVGQKAKASGVQSLSSEEMQHALNRMRLENQFRKESEKFNPGLVKKGHEHVKELLGLKDTADLMIKANDSSESVALIKSQMKSAAAKAGVQRVLKKAATA